MLTDDDVKARGAVLTHADVVDAAQMLTIIMLT